MQNQSTLYDYWIALYRRKAIILTVSVSALAFAVLISFYMPPVYEAKASFYLPMNVEVPSYTSEASHEELAQQPLIPVLNEASAAIHIGILKSDDVVNKLLQLFPEKSGSYFRKNVDITTSPELFIDVYVRDRDPDVAAKIANTYSVLYEQFHARQLSLKAQQTFDTIELKIEDLTAAIKERTEHMQQFQETNSLLSSSDIQERLSEQSMDMEHDLNMTLVDLKASSERLKTLQKQYKAELKKGHSNVIDTIRETLLREESEGKYLEAKYVALQEGIEEIMASTRNSLEMLTTMDSLTREKNILLDMLVNVKKNLAEAYLQKEHPTVLVVPVQHATPPTHPVFPRPILNAIVALLFGFAASCYYALFLEYLNRLRLNRIERNLSASPLGELQP